MIAQYQQPHHSSYTKAYLCGIRFTLLCGPWPQPMALPKHIRAHAHHHACAAGAPAASPYEWSRGMVVGRGPIMAASGFAAGEVGPRAPPYGSCCPAASACTLAAGTGGRGDRAINSHAAAVQYHSLMRC